MPALGIVLTQYVRLDGEGQWRRRFIGGALLACVLLAAASMAAAADFAERARMVNGEWEGYLDGRKLCKLELTVSPEKDGTWRARGRLEFVVQRKTWRIEGRLQEIDGQVVFTGRSSNGDEVKLRLEGEARLVGTVSDIPVPATAVFQKPSAIASAPGPEVPPAAQPPVPPRPAAQPPVAAAPRAPVPARPQPLVQPYANSWALVIGVNAYEKVSPRLNYAVADARAVAEALPALGFPRDNIRLLLDGEATKNRIERVLYREFAVMGPQDRLFLYFAGHGETAPIRGGEEGYLLPVDADKEALPLTAIPMDEIRRIGQRLKARHYLFVFDACFSGFAITRETASPAPTDEYVTAAVREPAIQVITAGRKGERAIEEGGHGLFTRRLLDGLRGLADPEGRGVITAGQLAAWLESRVVRDSNGRMTPQYGKLDGEGQFVFVTLSATTAPPPPRAAGVSIAAVQPALEEAAVLRVLDETVKAVNGADLNLMLAQYAADARIDSRAAGGRVSKEKYGESMRALLESGNLVRIEHHNRKVTLIDATHASVLGTSVVTMTTGLSGLQVEWKLEKRDARWVIVELNAR